MTKIQEFKEHYQRFIKALKYLIVNEQKLKLDPVKWQKIKTNFETKFEHPLDEAWQALNKEERKKLESLYLFRKATADETVKKIIDT